MISIYPNLILFGQSIISTILSHLIKLELQRFQNKIYFEDSKTEAKQLKTKLEGGLDLLITKPSIHLVGQ